jgi:hypothetical protein
MSGGISATAIAGLAAAALTTGATIYSANKSASAQKDQINAQKEALAAQTQAAKDAATGSTAATATQEAKAPSQSTTNAAAGLGGTGTNALGTGNFNSNTLLTGTAGVTDPLSLSARKLYGSNTASTDLLGG